ncbi:MAG: hypothetical protein Q9159_001815 [Coniocarpon cinnabarinum]
MANLGEDLLDIVNRLQDLVFNTIGNDSLDLPQIVVVGSQSSGKSSVLENIVGRDFLPRGSGIVTRRPLVLQLVNVPSERNDKPDQDEAYVPHTPASVSQQPEWAEFHHIPGRRFTDFFDVKREIENETSRIAGNNKGINRQPIHLKIYSPHILSLTLVDLPGLTKVPVGDQPSDIEKQTRNLISEYIAKPNSIILAVSPANVDIVNSEALKLARHVDPMGKRTIGVLTKLDLMDHGTNAIDILSGRVYPLKLGFIGVVNRSQQDIQGNKSLSDALQAEHDFFRHHPAYRNMAARTGTQFLAKTLNSTLKSHIREKLPDIKARLNTLMGQTQQELASYGDMTFTGKEHRGSLVLQLMTRFATSFITSVDGTSSEISTKELGGGARIYYIFNSVFGSSLESIDPNLNLSVSDIRTAIRNSTGPRPSLFVPELAFELLVKPQIKLLEIPSQRCVELVYEELIKICHTLMVEKSEREKSAKAAEERKKRERRRQKELNGPNGVQLNEEDEDHDPSKSAQLPTRAHVSKESRSMSPAVTHRVNGVGRSSSPVRFGGQGASTRDSFLNYFFGKEGTPQAASGTAAPPGAAHSSSGSRHVSQNIEPSFAASLRRGDTRQPDSRGTSREYAVEDGDTFSNIDNEPLPPLDDKPELTEREHLETALIRRLISSYFDIVRETTADQVPKAVMHLLVNHSKDVVQNRLVSELYKEDLFAELLHEDEGIKGEREKCERLLGTYREAAKIIGEVL